jgi:hypothetical protein
MLIRVPPVDSMGQSTIILLLWLFTTEWTSLLFLHESQTGDAEVEYSQQKILVHQIIQKLPGVPANST